VLDFAQGRAQLVAVRAVEGGALVGQAIREMRGHLPAGADARVAAIFRRGSPVKPEASTVIEIDDEVFFLAERRHVPVVMAELRRMERKPTRRLMIAGGGNIGRNLARVLEQALRAASRVPAANVRLGAISFVQRFGAALNEHWYFHVCVSDGQFTESVDGRLQLSGCFTTARDRVGQPSGCTRRAMARI